MSIKKIKKRLTNSLKRYNFDINFILYKSETKDEGLCKKKT